MRNICYVNLFDMDSCGSLITVTGTNEVILNIRPLITQLTGYKVEVTKSSGSVVTSAVLEDVGGVITYKVSSDCYSSAGTMKVRLLSNEGNSGYVSFTVSQAITGSDDVQVKYLIDTGSFDISKISVDTGYKLPVASSNVLGGVKVGSNLTIASDGKLSVPVATTSRLGVVKIGSRLTIGSDGTLSANDQGGVTEYYNGNQISLTQFLTAIFATGQQFVPFKCQGIASSWGISITSGWIKGYVLLQNSNYTYDCIGFICLSTQSGDEYKGLITHTNGSPRIDWFDTPWTALSLTGGATASTVAIGTRSTPSYKKKGDRVYIEGAVAFSNYKGSTIIANLPSGYRPTKNRYVINACSGTRVARVYVGPDGNLRVEWIVNISNGSSFTGNITWVQLDISYFVD